LREDSVRYLLGDSTACDLDFNFLTFLREAVDCAVVLLEAEATLAANLEKRAARASEWAGMIRAVEELGGDASSVVDPIIKEQPSTPAGRCAAAIAKAIKDAVASETAAAKSSSTAARDEVDRDDQQVRARARTVLEKLLRTHDLPEAEKTLEATWSGGSVKAKLRETTAFGVEIAIQLDASASAVLVPDLRVDRIAENVEVHVTEAGGWLKKGDKRVAQKLGRYQVVAARVGKGHVVIQLRSADASGTTLAVTVPRSGSVAIDGGAPGKEYTLEERDRAGIKMLADKVEAALRDVSSQRTALIELLIDAKPFGEHPHPRVLAERMVLAIAPTVRLIASHSRSPGELVLRRQLADDRREEVFISISELMKKIETLPIQTRVVFAPLHLSGEASPEAWSMIDSKPEVPAVRPPVVPSTSQPAARGSARTMPPNPPPRAHAPTAPAPESVVIDDAKIAASIDAALDDTDATQAEIE
jgi:hypothetical protein